MERLRYKQHGRYPVKTAFALSEDMWEDICELSVRMNTSTSGVIRKALDLGLPELTAATPHNPKDPL